MVLYKFMMHLQWQTLQNILCVARNVENSVLYISAEKWHKAVLRSKITYNLSLSTNYVAVCFRFFVRH